MMTTTGSPKTKRTRKPRKTAAVKKLPSNPFMNEILELVSKQKTSEEMQDLILQIQKDL